MIISLQIFFQINIVEWINIFNESPNIQRSQKCDIFKKDLTWEPGVNIQKKDQGNICTKDSVVLEVPYYPRKGLEGQ